MPMHNVTRAGRPRRIYSSPEARNRLDLSEYGWHMVENAGNFDVKEWSIEKAPDVSNAEARTCWHPRPQREYLLLLESELRG